MNEDFLNELYRSNGTTNMNEFYFNYLNEKKAKQMKESFEASKPPSSAMLPQGVNPLKPNGQFPNFPQNVNPGLPMNPNNLNQMRNPFMMNQQQQYYQSMMMNNRMRMGINQSN